MTDRKTLVISDLHLTDKFDQKKYNFLVKLISDYDQVIINGDLWCVLIVTFDQFVKSKWNQLFPLLKAKKTSYIAGNHDPAKFTDRRARKFCNRQVNSLVLKKTAYTFHIHHGPKLLKRKYPEDEKTINFLKAIKFQPIMQAAQILALKLIGLQAPEITSRTDNNFLKEIARKLPANHFLITGHTHLPEFDRQNKYINTGFIDGGYASYLSITDKSLQLVKTRY